MGSTDYRQNHPGAAITAGNENTVPACRSKAGRWKGPAVVDTPFPRKTARAVILACILVALHLLGAAAQPVQLPPVYSTLAGKTVPVSITLPADTDVTEVRLYFKTMAAADFFFIPMTSTDGRTFDAHLPPAKNDTKGLDYLVLLISGQGETRKTRPLRLLVLNDYLSPQPVYHGLKVQTERPGAATENSDFAVPLQVTSTTAPLLDQAMEDPYPQRAAPAPHSPVGLSGFGGISFSIKIGGAGFFYRSMSGQ